MNSSKQESVFDVYTGDEDEDFAFNKTVVPIKPAFYEGERLVSHSQGICSKQQQLSISAPRLLPQH